MAERLTTEQRQLITAYRQQFAELRTYSDEQILSIINNAASDITLSEDERVSILSNNLQGLNLGGLTLESQPIELSQDEEVQLLSLLQARSEAVTAKTEEAESKNGFLGKAWNWTKNNLLDWCTDSTNDIKKAQAEEQEALKNGNVKEAFEKITGLEYTSENISKFTNGELKTKSEIAVEAYEEGQEMAADFAGDFVSGIAAVGIYTSAVAAAPFTGGTSIAVGLAAATVSAGLIKSGLKAWDAHSAKREYTTFTKDFITGGFSGLLAPITGGIGGAVGRNVATRLGVQAMKQVGKEAVEQTGKQTIKTMLTNPVGYEYVGKRWALALGTEMAADGALGGSIDTAFRTGYEQIESGEGLDWSVIGESAIQGGIGGAILSPVIGGGIKGAGKVGHKIGDTIRLNNTHLNFNEMPIATTKSQLKKLLKDAGYDFEKYSDVKDLINNCEKPEDYQKLSVIFNGLNGLRSYRIRDIFHKLNDLEEADIFAFLLKNNHSGDIQTIQLIKANPLLREVYEKGLPILNGRPGRGNEDYAIVDVAPHIKTKEHQQAVIQVIEASENHASFGYTRGTVASTLEHFVKKPEDIDGYVRFIYELFSTNFWFNSNIRSDDLLSMESVFRLTRDKDNSISNQVLCCLFDKIKYMQTNEYSGQILEAAAKLHESGVKEFRILDVIDACLKDDNSFDKNILDQKKKKKTPAEIILKAAEIGGSRIETKGCYSFGSSYPNGLRNFVQFCTDAEGKIDMEKFRLGLDFNSKSEYADWATTIRAMWIEESWQCNANILPENKFEISRIISQLDGQTWNKMELVDAIYRARVTSQELLDCDLIRVLNHMLRDRSDFSGKLDDLLSLRKTKEFSDGIKHLHQNEINEEQFLSLLRFSDKLSFTNLKKAESILGKEDFATLENYDIVRVTNYVVENSISRGEISLAHIKTLVRYSDEISYQNYQKAQSIIGKEDFAMLQNYDVVQVANYVVKNSIRQGEISLAHVKTLIKHADEISYQNYQKVQNLIGKEDFSKYPECDVVSLCKYIAENNIPKGEITPEHLLILSRNVETISYRDIKKLQRVIEKEKFAQLREKELIFAAKFVDIIGKTNINEIPITAKRKFLKQLVASNVGLFEIPDNIAKDFPLLPRNREQYCELLPAIVKSLGIDVAELKPGARIEAFNASMHSLEETLAKVSDSDFANLHITQDFSNESFIRTVLEKVKHLSTNEKQKVFDYFGFELHSNKFNETGYSISGYPINLNNGKKLADITDSKTKSVVELLRPDVIRFSERNPIRCNNPAVEKLLNEIIEVLPELRTQIGRKQHGAHDYSVMQHSLKVLQKISQDPNFKTLNESDKKIMMLASLLHDITKVEGISDKTHASEGSFDAFFIAKKFNLTKDEEIKLFTLIRQHEWLGYVNTAKSEQELRRRLQSVAYDLRQDNLFDMALMFTHADLRAVKKSDYFHDTTIGDSRARFNGETRVFDKTGGTPVSHGEVADIYARRIREYVNELKKSQPLLPVTRMPKASTIAKAITHVNPDGTTNIKGVYKDSDGFIVIKYNEVEDWQALGFPNGVSSRGTMAKGINLKGEECDVETGNIKFFVHGLDYVNQLAKFDAFGLIDSDVLLSVSYAERPESKFRFFRTQGVLLDVDTKYVHGGGNTDSGSGCGKFLDKFKRDYLFGAGRESDRLYISNMIKEATGMDDAEYIAFVKANENKAMHEIEPAEIRDKIIKAFATINSNVRRGNREYNEMYITNPDVMGVFAYAPEGKVGNALSYVNSSERLTFLKEHAIERDLPFIVFGD